MKTIGQKYSVALVALLLAGTVLTSATTKSPEIISEPEAVEASIEFEDDLSYMEDIEEYVDEYIDSMMAEEEQYTPETIKIYDENGELILEENISENDLSEEATRLMRQSEYLTEYDDTTYYRLNS